MLVQKLKFQVSVRCASAVFMFHGNCSLSVRDAQEHLKIKTAHTHRWLIKYCYVTLRLYAFLRHFFFFFAELFYRV